MGGGGRKKEKNNEQGTKESWSLGERKTRKKRVSERDREIKEW